MLDKKQAAVRLGVTVSTLDGSLKSEIPRYKIGGSVRFKESEVDAYIESCRVKMSQPMEIGRFKYVPGMKVCNPMAARQART